MKVYTIIQIILALLATDPGGVELGERHIVHLTEVAESVHSVAKDKQATDEEVRIILAIGMRESRFGVPYSEYFPTSHVGACGLWQVRPRLTDYNESCHDFRDTYYAAVRGLEEVRYWREKKGRLCHYKGGWNCRAKAKSYENDISRYAQRALAHQ